MVCCLLLFFFSSFIQLNGSFFCTISLLTMNFFCCSRRRFCFFVFLHIHTMMKEETNVKKLDCFIVANGFQRVVFPTFFIFFFSFFVIRHSIHPFGCIKSSQVHRAYFNVEKWRQFLKWNDNDIAILVRRRHSLCSPSLPFFSSHFSMPSSLSFIFRSFN